MEDLEALCKKLSFLSTKNQLKWNGSKNDLLRFLALHLEVQPNQFRASDNGTCAVFKIQNITCNFYHKADPELPPLFHFLNFGKQKQYLIHPHQRQQKQQIVFRFNI